MCSNMEYDGDLIGFDPNYDWAEPINSPLPELPGFEEVGAVLAGEVSQLAGDTRNSDAGRGSGQAVLEPRVRTRANRLKATAFFLTYSQSKLRKEEISTWFQRQPRVKRCIAALEHHKDGHEHYHVFVEYTNQKDVTTKYFDILHEHPNILIWTNKTQSYEEWSLNHWEYCLKEDENAFTIGEKPEIRKRKRDEIATETRKRACETGVAEAMQYLAENAAWEHLTKYDVILRALMSMRNKCRVADPARPLSAFKNLPLIVDGWENLYISGPTGCGKTAFARALLPEATVVRHRNQLLECDFSKGIIFDDFDVCHWPPTAVIHLLDWEESSGIDVKHSHVIIPPHTRKIFTHNNAFEDWLPKGDDKMLVTEGQRAAMRRRVHVVNIHSKLF